MNEWYLNGLYRQVGVIEIAGGGGGGVRDIFRGGGLCIGVRGLMDR